MNSLILFVIGLIHNLVLIALFYIRKDQKKQTLVMSIGKVYLGIMFPSSIIFAWIIYQEFQISNQFIISILIFIYLCLELLYDYILKLDFRSNFKYLIPYLIFYYLANYSIVVLTWELSQPFGIVLLVLFILQIIVNTWSHPKITRNPLV